MLFMISIQEICKGENDNGVFKFIEAVTKRNFMKRKRVKLFLNILNSLTHILFEICMCVKIVAKSDIGKVLPVAWH